VTNGQTDRQTDEQNYEFTTASMLSALRAVMLKIDDKAIQNT